MKQQACDKVQQQGQVLYLVKKIKILQNLSNISQKQRITNLPMEQQCSKTSRNKLQVNRSAFQFQSKKRLVINF
jgi:hypothetical protein